MSEINDYLLKYFFVVGVPDYMKEDLKINAVKENNRINPVLLSSYSAEGKTELFEKVKSLLNEDLYLQYNIFPIKANFLSNVTFYSNELEPPTLNLKSNPFNQYIYTVKSFNQIPEHFSHCFQYIFKLDEKNEDNIILNFSVLIFFENVTDERELLMEKNSKIFTIFYQSKYYNTYIGKAIILVSEKPIFSLMKEILEYIYKKFIIKKYVYFPIEPLIINCLEKINNDNEEEENKNNEFKQYRLYKEPLLPYCDLNLSFFFKLFNLKDIFTIAEFYLCSKNIVIISSNVEFLFPIYYILMTLFFPLNKNSNERFYKLIVPDEQNLQRTLFGMMPTFQFIYYDDELDKKIENKICEIKEEILIIQILKDKKNKNEHLFSVAKKILKYEGGKKISKIGYNNYKTIIEKVFSLNYDIYTDLYLFLINDIKEINEYFDKKKKIPTFFDSSFDYKKYDLIRNHFIGLFIKFFVICLNPIKFNLNDYKIEIDIIDFKKLKDDPNANELLSTLYTTPQSDLIYKNEIIKNGKFDNKILKKIILLDYFLKISLIDEKRSYFEPKSSVHKINLKEINFNFEELFNYRDILDDNKNIYYYFNRLYLYPLQYSKKVYYIIDEARKFLDDIEYYQELTKIDKTKEIDNIKKFFALKYIVFFGEKFDLHFGQFVNKNYKIQKNNNEYENEMNKSHIDFLENNIVYKKYYKSTLDEAEIFYDLFVTQIIVSENRKQLACCAIGLFVSIYIINLLSELSSKNPNKKQIIENINKNKEKLFELFKITKGYYGKYDFLITLLFEIVSSHGSDTKYANLLIKKLEEEKILPTIIVILMYNHDISLNFRGIKEYFEESNKRNKMINKIEQRKSFNNFDLVNFELKKYMTERIKKKEQKEEVDEISIYSIERNKHEHKYNILEGINNDYNCENKDCQDILSFTIQKSKNGIKDVYLIYNPRYIIINLLKRILDNNSLFIYPYDGHKDDIYQIVMLDQLYFQIGFFLDEKEEKNEILKIEKE